jgi:hypothetical protein
VLAVPNESMPIAGKAGERGTAAVEFALVLPLVLVLTLALVQVGLLARDRLIVEAAARAGTRGSYPAICCTVSSGGNTGGGERP